MSTLIVEPSKIALLPLALKSYPLTTLLSLHHIGTHSKFQGRRFKSASLICMGNYFPHFKVTLASLKVSESVQYISRNEFSMGVQLLLSRMKTELYYFLFYRMLLRLHLKCLGPPKTRRALGNVLKTAVLNFILKLYCCSGISCQIMFFLPPVFQLCISQGKQHKGVKWPQWVTLHALL